MLPGWLPQDGSWPLGPTWLARLPASPRSSLGIAAHRLAQMKSAPCSMWRPGHVDWPVTCEDLLKLWADRRQPFLDELAAIEQEREATLHEIEMLTSANCERPPGPAHLKWVDGFSFASVCNIIVALNLASP